MKKLGLLAGSVIGMFALAPSHLSAVTYYPPLSAENVEFTLTAVVQGKTTDIYRGKGEDRETVGQKVHGATKVKINNKTILKLLHAPTGAKLILTDGNILSFQVGDNSPVETGYLLQIDSGVVVVTKGEDSDIDSSNDNHERSTKKSTYQAEYVATAVLAPAEAVPGFALGVTGCATEKEVTSVIVNDGSTKQVEDHMFQVSGAGEGIILDDDSAEVEALVSGTIKTSAKTSRVLAPGM